MERKWKKFTSSLHTHVKSLNDAQIEPNELCDRIKEIAGEDTDELSCAVTDHGVLTSIMDYKEVFEAKGIKMIPGCEIYVYDEKYGRMHFILLAKNFNGYLGVCKIVTESNRTLRKGFPTITANKLMDIMRNYIGDIVATSACMQGVLAVIFLQNSRIDKEIISVQEKRKKYISCESEEYKSCTEKLHSCENDVMKATEERDECKRYADMKFVAREKAVSKLEKNNDEKAMEARAELEKDKELSELAKEELQNKKDALDKAKKELSKVKKEMKVLDVSVENYKALDEKIRDLESRKVSDSDMMTEAREKAEFYCDAFGKENFYIEVQYHEIPEEAICFPKLVKLADIMGISLVASNDVHILTNSEEDRLRREILRSMRFGKTFEEEMNGDAELYLKDNDELAEWLMKILPEAKVTEAINNIEKISSQCNIEWNFDKHYPEYPTEGNTPLDVFNQKIEDGTKMRFPEGFPDETYKKRLEYEKEIIISMGYVSYHLIVADFLEFGKKLGKIPPNILENPENIPDTMEGLDEFIKKNGWENNPVALRIGPGRGSAVGSLVCFLLGITSLDPLKYGLLFERFLNPERISMPDIDSDLSNRTREIVIAYLKKKYGANALCGILTKNAQAPKGSIGISAKYYGLKTYNEAMTSTGRELSKLVPDDIGTKFSTLVDTAGNVTKDGTGITLYEWMLSKAKNKDQKEIIRWAKIMEGSFTAYSSHAAGIGIMSKGGNIGDFIPLKNDSEDGWHPLTQCDMVQFEEMGFLKFDLLGLKTLDIISETIHSIKENYGVTVDPLSLDLNDPKVYREIFATGKTTAVFQLESDGMKNLLKDFFGCSDLSGSNNYEDLIIPIAMYRPGPMQFIPDLIAVKSGKKEVEFLCPELEPILGKTYGCIIYQEQVMEIFQKLAGYSLGSADLVRRFMSKKKKAKLEHEKEAFINGDSERGITGCVANGIQAEVAEKLFNQMLEFAKYAFNKSHAGAYAFVAFITAWLKCYYPTEFLCSVLNWTADTSAISRILYECKEFNIEVLPPDVNVSEKNFVTRNGKILYGLKYVRGVKDHSEDILVQRNKSLYKDLKDFCIRTKTNISVVTNLISAGAMDCFASNREALRIMAEEIKELCEKIKKKNSILASAQFVLPKMESFKDNESLIKDQIDNGFKAEIKEITSANKLSDKIETTKESLKTLYDDLSLIRLQKITEDKNNRMRNEKEVLGNYVTAHPMDYYPSRESLGINYPICDVAEGDTRIYGVITGLSIRNRKSDGAEMAFFDLEDHSGSIPVACFTSEFKKYSKFLQEGAVITISGICNTETRFVGEEEYTSKKFIAKSIGSVKAELSTFILTVPNFALFHLEVEKDFREMYESIGRKEAGHKFVIYDSSMDEYVRMKYRVKESVLASGLPLKEL